MRFVLGVDILDTLRMRSSERDASCQSEKSKLTWMPLTRLFPREKKFSFINRSSCR